MKKTIALILISFSMAAHADYKSSDKKLNILYKQYLAKLIEPGQKAQFIAAQKTWVKFKELDCKFHASGTEGGTASAEIVGLCLESRTDERIKHLEYFINCTEGDLSCPVF